ncbi:MAG: hypothetical protein K0S41_42 [Anaerocolumna sp.]|nr:hypothetical protein [Anaerocolumna sp.]
MTNTLIISNQIMYNITMHLVCHLYNMLQTIQLKALCWPEELAGMADNKLDIDSFWIDWMHSGVIP